MLFPGSGLLRQHLGKKFVKSVSRHLCKSYAKAKITRRLLHLTDSDTLQASKLLEKATADIVVYRNCPSRQGNKSIFVIKDVVTKMH